MGFSKTPECGMITFRPLKEEYTEDMRNWFIENNWFGLFDAWAIIEEQHCHLHIPFKVNSHEIGKHKERTHKKIYDYLPNVFINKEVACYISWPEIKKGENFVKCVGYTLKGIKQRKQDYEVLKKINIDDAEWEQCITSMNENTPEQKVEFLKLPQVANLAKEYVNKTPIHSTSGFLDYIADLGLFYLCNERQIESMYEQAARIVKRQKLG